MAEVKGGRKETRLDPDVRNAAEIIQSPQPYRTDHFRFLLS